MKAPRFKLSTVLTWMTIVALLIAWFTSLARERTRIAQLSQQLANAQLQVSTAEMRGEAQAELTAETQIKCDSVFAIPRLEGMDLRDLVIQGGGSAFQLMLFDNSNLTGTSLTGGESSFQEASFKKAILKNAKLVGGSASFQLAVFENADLSGATLAGNLQAVSLKNAKCTGATIQGSFQGANIDGAQFESADLSGIRSDDLASCYFVTPPTFDAKTKFPDGFSPVDNGWKQAIDSPKK
jgi:uncharacterized protein YjbI with pentapeptide repeats